MSPRTVHESEQENPGISGSEDDRDDEDDVLDEDLAALRRACMIAGMNPRDLHDNIPSPFSHSAASVNRDYSAKSPDSESDDDLELVRSIQNRFSVSSDLREPLSLEPLASVVPQDASDEEDDFETLLAIQRRFSGHGCDTFKHGVGSLLKKPEQVHASSLSLEKETTDNLFVNRTDACEGFTDADDFCNSRSLDDNEGVQRSGLIESHQSRACNSPMLPLKKSCFPKSALLLLDAIKKNRSSQRFLRSKLIQLEARIEENKRLKERVKILKDFQASCKKRTGRALSQKKDPRVQLISVKKSWASKDPKIDDKRLSAMYHGPEENSHVSNYRMVLTNFPLTLEQKKWSKAERENLGKGIKQQFHQLVVQISVDRISGSDASSGDTNDFDKILMSIKNLKVTPEKIREFLPKVNWDQLASMYVVGHSGAECKARWLNYEDPLINNNPWTAKEDKNLLLLVQEKGINNWFDIAVSLGTNRTPFHCLARYQRSLNASILKREWSKDEDAQLRSAVDIFGERDWQSVASTLEGRTGNQCSNRWKKSLHPTRERVGRWIADEDKRLKVAVMLFGPKNWNKIAQFVPGRTQVQCRERWVNSLDPSLNWGEWTKDEDSRLKAAIMEHGYCWSKVAACVPPRTDNQCRRRWKVLLPDEVPMLREARRIQKAALISNFVDRESERPALYPSDFLPLPITSISEPESLNPCSKQKGRLGNASRRIRSKKGEQQSQACSATTRKKTSPKSHSRSKKCTKPVADNLSLPLPLPTGISESGTINDDCIDQRGVYTSTMHGGTPRSKEKNKASSNAPRRIRSKKGEPHTCSGTTQKETYPKSRTRRKKCTEPIADNGLPLPPPTGSLESGTINDGCIEAAIDKSYGANESGRNICSTDLGESWNSTQSSGKSMFVRKKCIEPVADNLSLPLRLPPGSLESGTINDVCIEAAIGKSSAAYESGRNICTTDLGENQNSTWSWGKSMFSEITNNTEHIDHTSCVDLTLLTITNGEVVDSLDGNVCAGQEGTFKLQSDRKQCMDLTEDNCSSCFHPVSLDFRKNDGEGVGSSFLDKENRVLNLLKKRKRSNEPSGECHNVSLPCRQDGPKVSTCRNISKQNLGTGDRDGITLASFLSNKPTKRRIKVAKNVHEACSPGSLIKVADSHPNEVDKLRDGNQILSAAQDLESQACFHAGNPDNLLPCTLQSVSADMPIVADGDSGPGGQDLVQQQVCLREPMSISLEDDEDDCNITLACFMKNKLKRRRFQSAKTAKHHDGNQFIKQE
ncbi:hypothetical protein I3760_15G121600 [Carya illinoinensis]|nr:hypothetical protein I3760_15G121600 [Carya illinoinensis]KAG2667557.1 hypothetical protein I3760_15G121600 [Carya illinoinensis]KAG2667561.1 hypothetical protein I3760_15G121600 [Carya illinoinensis]KAG2667563.1 hypothetical protein I3760_15G121600 [Carya illinoinensis]